MKTMRIMKTILLAIFAFSTLTAFADDVKQPNSYNYVQGVTALNQGNYDEALEYLNKEISEYPKNGYAYLALGVLYIGKEQPVEALANSNFAIKYLPSKDSDSKALAYSFRAKVYLSLQDTAKALNDLEKAIEKSPLNPDYYNMRGGVYGDQGKYDLSNIDYQKAISLDESNVDAYVGVAENALHNKKYEDVNRLCDYVNKLAPDYSYAYVLRSKSYISQDKYKEAVNDIVEALNIDNNNDAISGMRVIADTLPEIVLERLKVQKVKNPDNMMWNFYLGMVYEQTNDFPQAVTCYEETMENNRIDAIAGVIANCYKEMGMAKKALEYYNMALETDSTSAEYMYGKALVEKGVGMYKEALADINSYIAAEPEDGTAYGIRGVIKGFMGETKEALDDLTTAVTTDPDDISSLMDRGILYDKVGEHDKAVKDYENVIRIDTVAGKNVSAAHAYRALGDKEKFETLAKEIWNKGKFYECYNLACIYSLFGETSKALDAMKTALEKGLRRFDLAECDPDLENVRKLPAFAELVNGYKEKYKQETEKFLKEAKDSVYEKKVEEIPFVEESDLCKVKCSINGLPLHFIFDTGASTVTISSVEAAFMNKNGYLTPSDVVGKRNFQTATGDIEEGTVINLRDVKIGGLHLKGVRASVVKNQSAPLLLGQSVLKRLGKIEIDNVKKVMRVTYLNKVSE